MSNLKTYKDRLADSGWLVFERAVVESQQDNVNCIVVEHVLLALLNDKGGLLHKVVQKLEVDSDLVVHLLRERQSREPRHNNKGTLISPEAISLFKLAMDVARADQRERIEASDLVIALSQNLSSPLTEILSSVGIHQDSLIKVVREVIHSRQRRDQSRTRTVRIKSGPYAGFAGRVKELSGEERKVRVAVAAFGRTIDLEMDRSELEELSFLRQ
ncbi:MAG TPA: Clp protease N-terminal domain-containing protein [Pyrinomonadaceae bacterium]|nr:Clp protease N-terminal domain-containing protein [Pyrinomonadaceae bacterium]